MATCNECLYQPICNTYASFGITDLPASDIAPCVLFKSKANVAEVVRCKDCKHRVENSKMCSHPKAIGWDAIEPDDNDFCSYGERKEDK